MKAIVIMRVMVVVMLVTTTVVMMKEMMMMEVMMELTVIVICPGSLYQTLGSLEINSAVLGPVVLILRIGWTCLLDKTDIWPPACEIQH